MPESNSSTDSGFVVARLGRPHGLDGYLGLYVDEADIVHFQPTNTVLVEDRPHAVRAIRRTDKGHQVQFEGVSTREQAEQIRGLTISVTERRDLADDEFWPEDLAGLEVRSSGTAIGKVTELVEGAAQDRLAVEIDSNRYEIPFVAELVPTVDVAGGYVEIALIPGLIEPLS